MFPVEHLECKELMPSHFLSISSHTTWIDTMSTMTSSVTVKSGKTYAAPKIPDTPSATINKMLNQRCNKTFDNPVKYGIAFYICMVFQVIDYFSLINSLRSELNGRHFPDYIYKCIFLKENICHVSCHWRIWSRGLTHRSWDKMADISRRQIQKHFLEWKYMNFDQYFTEVCS